MPTESTIKRYMSSAKKASLASSYPRQKIGAVMVYGNKVIATGCNTYKTNPMQHKYNKLRFNKDCINNGVVHAETALLLKTKYLDVDWSRVTIYVYRERKDGSLGLAKPCMACQIALEERGITEIYYTTDTGYEKL